VTPEELTASSAIYGSYVEDLGRIGGRHETVRAFYITLLTTLFTFLALAGKDGLLQDLRAGVQALVGLVGVAVCVAWALHMRAFADIYQQKFKALRAIEANLPIKPFSQEDVAAFKVHITAVDQVLAVVVGLLFIVLWLTKHS
jgi:hypothetical protein